MMVYLAKDVSWIDPAQTSSPGIHVRAIWASQSILVTVFRPTINRRASDSAP